MQKAAQLTLFLANMLGEKHERRNIHIHIYRYVMDLYGPSEVVLEYP